MEMIEDIEQCATATEMKERRCIYGLKENKNPFFKLKVDIFKYIFDYYV